ncbi:hypothetical protein HO173_009569 [Letharia columbiana]|uniref:Methyltransferase domain-containing protein n=1 Tax=Letharia columbiana TaxID=112416 RepID=A0A8H6FPF3_9LECA|nr:uncharacterized protein HO173_009569 [Letharia columbiana]KAF6232186.1 hypothetical protein HO173_009569 [Letharia columbiana]
MANGKSALDVCTPSLTPVTNAKLDNGKRDKGSLNEGVENVEYTLKPTTRAYASTARLNLQHYLWKDQTGYLLHPSIPLSGIENLKIADVGTGTGIWLLDLARTLPPTAQLDGFDIDISDCPPEQWLPRNVRMRHLDALGEIPEHLAGKYDIVQLRLFQVVVKDNDPGPLLRNMVKMLKPGGHLQWGEYDMTTHTTIKASPSLSTTALDAIPAFVQGFKKRDGRVGVQNWIPHLPQTFLTHSLTHTTSTRHATAPPYLPSQLDIYLLTYEELAAKTFDPMPGGHGDRLRELVVAAGGGGPEGRRVGDGSRMGSS